MAGLVFLLVFWALAGACQMNGVGVFFIGNSPSSSPHTALPPCHCARPRASRERGRQKGSARAPRRCAGSGRQRMREAGRDDARSGKRREGKRGEREEGRGSTTAPGRRRSCRNGGLLLRAPGGYGANARAAATRTQSSGCRVVGRRSHATRRARWSAVRRSTASESLGVRRGAGLGRLSRP